MACAIGLVVTGCRSSSPARHSRETPQPSAADRHAPLNAWVEVDTQAFEANVQTLRSRLSPGTRLCAVLKADAYGNGIPLLVPSLKRTGIDFVGIADNEEARQLRQGGFRGRIMRLRTATLDEIRAAFRWRIEELLGNADLADQAALEARRRHQRLAVHLALNSAGMSRNGLEMSTESGRQDALHIARLDGIDIVGLMTHFPTDNPDDVRRGLQAFREEADWVLRQTALPRHQVLLHCANTFATLEVPETHLDMVRVGGALYGDAGPTHPEYHRTQRFLTRVASVNAYPAGNTVSYDRTYTLTRDSRLANLPVGYSDGYRRSFSNRGHVLIRGHRVPIVGRVTMNTVMIDVTDFPDIAAGDEAVLFGRQGSEEITAAEIEELTGTILPDLYTVWGTSNPKVPASSVR